MYNQEEEEEKREEERKRGNMINLVRVIDKKPKTFSS